MSEYDLLVLIAFSLVGRSVWKPSEVGWAIVFLVIVGACVVAILAFPALIFALPMYGFAYWMVRPAGGWRTVRARDWRNDATKNDWPVEVWRD